MAQVVPPVSGGSIKLPTDFAIHGVTKKLLAETPSAAPTPPLHVLDNFKGTFVGTGFNNIFRPQSSATPTTFPNNPVQGPTDNVLELNLTAETLAFADALGSVPNRGSASQGDIFLSGVPYVQTISDVTNPVSGKNDGIATGIHFEPGLWMRVPASTTNPVAVESLNRMASIPHGTTINAQGIAPTGTSPGAPVFPKEDITPVFLGGGPFAFPSQTANLTNTLRLPQDLTTFIKAGTITQAILDDPTTVLRRANTGKTINHNTLIQISTAPLAGQLGGGTANIDFLVGATQGSSNNPNAQAVQMSARFWISEVSHKLTIPIHALGQGPLQIPAPIPSPGVAAPTFIVDPPVAITAPKTITVTSTQIQYAQNVSLNFAGLKWPHVSVATLIPRDPIPVPNSVFGS